MPDSPSKSTSPPAGPPRSLGSFFSKLGRRTTSQYGSIHSLTSSATSTPASRHESASDKLSSMLGSRTSQEGNDHHNQYAAFGGTRARASSASSETPFRSSYSAAKTVRIGSSASKESESLLWMKRMIQQVKIDALADPVEIWSMNSSLLSMTWSKDLSSAGVDLLRICVLLSNESSNDLRASYIRRLYYEQVRQVFNHAFDVLDESSLQGLVAVLEALSRGGRDVLGLDYFVPLLIDIAARLTELRQAQRLRYIDLRVASTPLLDSAFATPFVRLPPETLFLSSDPRYSPAALLIQSHRFSFSHIPEDDIEQTMSRFIVRGLQGLGEHEVRMVLEFIDTVVKFGYIPPSHLEDVVKYVARVAGIEGRVNVIEVSPDGDLRDVELSSDLSNQAHNVMTNLLRSPANQALKHLRGILSTSSETAAGTPQCPTPLLIGALRCLRRAYKDYETIVADLQAEEPSKTSADNYPTLLSLGMTVLHQNMLDGLEWRSDEVDSEVLLFLEERFSSRAQEKKYFSYDEWEMVISILERMTWHIRGYEETTGKPWSIESASIRKYPLPAASSILANTQSLLLTAESSRRLPTHMSKAEAAPATLTTSPFTSSESTGPTATMPVLASFSLVINRMLAAQALDTFTGSHLRFFDFLLTIARHLSSSALVSFFNFYNARQLATPGHVDWILRLQSIVSVFFPSTPYSYVRETVKSGRRSVMQLLDDSYTQAQGEDVTELMTNVVFPLFEDHLAQERDTAVLVQAFHLMDKCATDSLPDDNQTAERVERFDRLAILVKTLSWQQPLPELRTDTSRSESFPSTVQSDRSPDRAQSRTSIAVADVGFAATQLLIKMFYQCIVASNTRTSRFGVNLFRHMLDMVSYKPASDPQSLRPSKGSRFAILQCLVRLRADQRHRVFSRQHLDFEELARHMGKVHDPEASADATRGKDRGRPKARRDQQIMESDQTAAQKAASRSKTGSRSRTRAANLASSPTRQRTTPATSLWSSPDILTYPFPARAVRSTGMLGIASFDHVNMRDWSEAEALEDTGDNAALAPAIPPEGGLVVLPVSGYLQVISDILLQETDWDVVSYVLCAVPNQLANKHYSCGPRAARQLQSLCHKLCEHLNKDTLGQQVGLPAHIKLSDVHAVAYQWLATLIAYRDLYRREKQNEIVVTFMRGLSKTPNIAKPSIHALTMACYEFEASMSKYLPEILGALVRIMSTVNMPVHILELVASIGHIRSLYANFTEDDYKKVFAVGVQYLSTHYENLLDDPSSAIVPEDLKKALGHAFGQYVFTLSFYVIALWYTIIPTSERARYTSFVVHRLLRAIESHGKLDGATEVSLDMLSRLAYSHTSGHVSLFGRSTNDIETRSWVIANSILTLESKQDVSKSTVIIRRPSGVLKQDIPLSNNDAIGTSILEILLKHRSSLQVDPSVQVDAPRKEEDPLFAADPAFFTLFLPPFSHINDYGLPRPVQDSDQTKRSLSVLDTMPHIDSHKIGILYVGPNQNTEQQILQNVHGSDSYSTFLQGLGDLTRLQGCKGNTGGLDREGDFDGKWTYIWSDDIQQMIFHVATLMPTRREQDPQCNYKKRHIGNDYVKILFNDSGIRTPFDILPGQFNFINIIIEPHTPAGEAWKGETGIANNTQFFRVSMQQRSDMPEMGPLGIFKMISTDSLPAFVRELALHANLFAQLFLQSVGVEGKSSTNRQKLEYTSTWRNRLGMYLLTLYLN